MRLALTVLVCVIGIAFIVFLVRSRTAIEFAVTSRDISQVVSQLQKSGKDGHFAVLIFEPSGSGDREVVNLQYSIDGGVVGLDWVFLSPRNIADQSRLKEFAARLGFRLVEQQMNNVRYLRVTGSGISELGTKIVEEFYGIAPDTQLGLITEGFKWQPKGQ